MNNKISTIIVDDEPACIKSLVNDLANFEYIEVLETITSPEKAKKAIIKQQPQLLFLDVEMPRINGIDLLCDIRNAIHNNTCVVFYSAFDKYMIDALRASAFDYLLKPYMFEELKAIIERAKEKIKTQQADFEQSIRRLLADDRKFALQTITGLLLLRRSEVVCFQYDKSIRCWKMTLTDMTTHKLKFSTKAKELLNISTTFAQISQDCIVNLDYLISIENSTLRCLLTPPFTNFNMIVSRRYYSKLKETLEII
ncbi:LytTR family DNA-binding domain-containing protein [Bacteroidales bacterium OttesenSCG-928-M11]|nr:LytTR family DNA-binding domain-containing protein [Bacteroidales bacterium OttesenSCG-928-M11]